MNLPIQVLLTVQDPATLEMMPDDDVRIGGFWDDFTNAVEDGASSAVDAVASGAEDAWNSSSDAISSSAEDAWNYAETYAKEHKDQMKALAMGAATAAGTAIAGPAGGAVAAGLTGQLVNSALGDPNAQAAIDQAHAQAAVDATHARLLNIAKRAFTAGTLATHMGLLVNSAKAGDANAQATIAQTAQAAAQGDPVAQFATTVAHHVSNTGYGDALSMMSRWR